MTHSRVRHLIHEVAREIDPLVLTFNMLLVTPTVLIVVFVVVAIIAAAACYQYKTHEDYQKSKIHIFVSVLGATAIILTAVLYFNLIQLHNRQSQTEAHKEMVDINQSILETLYSELKKASVKIPNFVVSLTPLGTMACDVAKETSGDTVSDGDTPVMCTWKRSISSRIFFIWQDVILGGKSVIGNMRSYIVCFLQMAVSLQLEEQWKTLRVNYSDLTSEFGDMLFEKAKTIQDRIDPMAYNEKAIEMINDPAYLAIKSKAKRFSMN